MSESIDRSHAPRGQMTASTLVDAISRLGDFAEHHYLEVKGPLDLSLKSTRAKIAKFILGAANRMPDKAASAFEGCAVMIIGVSKDKIAGIPPVEVMEISKVVTPFLGVTGPQWDAFWVPIQGSENHVLLIIVDPPPLGQGPFICRKDSDDVQNGRVYVRGDGETREATADELDLLIQRGNATPAPAVDFDVRIIGEVRSLSLDEAATLEAYIDRTRDRLLAALPKRTSESLTNSTFQELSRSLSALDSIQNYSQTAEDRTEGKYLEEIDSWEAKFRVAWPRAFRLFAGHVLPSPTIQIVNRTRTFFHDVQVEIHLEGNVTGTEYYGKPTKIHMSDLDLPSPPRRWGPRQNRLPDYLLPNLPFHEYPSMPSAPPRLDWRNADSMLLKLEVGDIRPLASELFDEEEFVFFVTGSGIDRIQGTWAITARDFNAVFTGDLEVSVGENLDLTQTLDHILNPRQEATP